MGDATVALEAFSGIDQTPVGRPLLEGTTSGSLQPAAEAAAQVTENLTSVLEAQAPSGWLMAYLDLCRRTVTRSESLMQLLAPRPLRAWTTTVHEETTLLPALELPVCPSPPPATTAVPPAEPAVEENPLPQDRATRAIRAVNDIAEWLGVSEAEAAQLAGGYRRSLYNWKKGIQPYDGPTLDLFETHALVSSLIAALGRTEAREWLEVNQAGAPRKSMLKDAEGRRKLSKLAKSLLYPSPAPAPRWEPIEGLHPTPPTTADAEEREAQRHPVHIIAPPPPAQD
ncbi:hypothetical protein GCM10010211_85380 [Streptomyces albospinus]|uniref:Uncharacterized protein n=1 Tax=Streptomyces albospinus TaxID=285515 RepID=A0ABQ2VRA6_9ACTN|nr:hypothetical protein [Streptomyces albospinus]GGV05357.1 hypothetical protein GCM10010211_85380 [Streptomyces albospinus]